MLSTKKVIQLVLSKSYKSERIKDANDDLWHINEKKLIPIFEKLYKQS